MFNFIVGFAVASVIFVFYPPLAAIIATGVRNAWAWLKAKLLTPRTPDDGPGPEDP